MKKEIALAALTALLAVNLSTDQPIDDPIWPEAKLDTYVTGCQCKSPKPIWSINKDNV